MPFSNAREEGFENALATLVADELGARVEYTWWPLRCGFIRSTLQARDCDVVMGVPNEYEMTLTTAPYYRSTYVFVGRADRPLPHSLADPRLKGMTIGLHVVGDDYASVPPGHALVRRELTQSIRGYSIYGDYSRPDPPADLIDVVAAGKVDVAIAWGPLGGYFASHPRVKGAPRLAVAPVPSVPGLPFEFSIAMGVRRDDRALRDRLDEVIRRQTTEIDALLDRFNVPRVRQS
jgi:mxaJ protein